jgi:hypothetical protein
MGTSTQVTDLAHVTPLLAIGEGGIDDVERAISKVMYGDQVVVSSPTKAAEVLRYFGCSREWIQARIDYALTGEMRSDLIG